MTVEFIEAIGLWIVIPLCVTAVIIAVTTIDTAKEIDDDEG